MIPLIQAKASYQDALLFIKTGMHIATNSVSAKKRICKALGIPENTSYEKYAWKLKEALRYSGEGEFAKKQMQKMGLEEKMLLGGPQIVDPKKHKSDTIKSRKSKK